MNQIRERCHLIYRNEAKSLAVFVSEKSTEFTYHRCRYRIPKSSVHRHLRNIKQRQSYAESLVGTKEGGDWLRLLVFAVIYCFGIKGGIGSESLSAFFRLLHLEENRVFCQCLERTGVQRTNHRLCKPSQRASHGEQPIGIWVGGDETFMACPFSWPWN